MDKDKASIDDMYNDILNLGQIFDRSEQATALVDGYKKN